jgi:hypothetical protein
MTFFRLPTCRRLFPAAFNDGLDWWYFKLSKLLRFICILDFIGLERLLRKASPTEIVNSPDGAVENIPLDTELV